jgi:hypothetical protein
MEAFFLVRLFLFSLLDYFFALVKYFSFLNRTVFALFKIFFITYFENLAIKPPPGTRFNSMLSLDE